MIFRTSDGTNLHCKEWLPAGPSVAVLVIIHGFGDACARYEVFARKLVENGIAVLAYDQRGHGESPGKRGDLADPSLLERDASEFIQKAIDGNGVVFVWAHSAGVQISVNALQRSGLVVRGVILSSGWFRLKLAPPFWKRVAARVLLGIAPGMILSTGLHSDQLSRDPAFLKALPGHELTHQKISSRMFQYLVDNGERALQTAPGWHLPLLIVHGSDDPVTDWNASREFHNHAASADKTWRLFEGDRHELQNDLHREELLDLMQNWILSRVGK